MGSMGRTAARRFNNDDSDNDSFIFEHGLNGLDGYSCDKLLG